MPPSGSSFERQLALLRTACDEREANINKSHGVATSGALKDVSSVRGILALAERMHAHDESTYVLQSTAASQAQIPNLAVPSSSSSSASRELHALRNLLTNSPWTKADDRVLCQSVLNECKRVRTGTFTARNHRDPLGALSALSEEDILQCAVDPTTRELIKWDDVAAEVSMAATATRKSCEECRTRWMMLFRPGVNRAKWGKEEFEALRRLVTTAQQNTQRLDWDAIAFELGTTRLPIDCLETYTRQVMHEDYDGSHLCPNNDDQAITHMMSIWGANYPLVGEKLNRTASSVADRFGSVLDERVRIGAWSEDELEGLEKGVKASSDGDGDTTGDKIQWTVVAQQYVGNRTWRQCRDRWNRVVRERAKEEAEGSASKESKKRKKA